MKSTILFIFLIFGCFYIYAQPIKKGTVQKLDLFLKQQIEKGENSGIYCIIVQNGKILLSKGYGRINGKQLISPKMIRQMKETVIGHKGDLIPWQPGYGFALGISVRVNDQLATTGGTLGDFGWFGFLGTSFWVDPNRKIIGIIMTQRPYDGYKLNSEVRNIIYVKQE